MYEFIDVIETSEGVSLPSEAMKINGEYIENLIEGYRTLTVEGREALSPEVSTYETGIRDGSTLKGKRYPARTIIITYQLIAKSNEEFRAAYNKLASILNVNDAELIFNDETDKYFIGTPALIGEVPPGRNSVVGEFEILCLDPFKYSVLEYEVESEPGESSILVDYNGTYKSFPRLEAEFYKENEASDDGETVTELSGSGDCGYVAFFNENKKIIQLGDPDEVDVKTDDSAYSQTLVNTSFDKSSSWGTAAKSQWNVNSGITSSDVVVQTGNVGIGVASQITHVQKQTSKTILDQISKADNPHLTYKIKAFVSDRKEDSVKIRLVVSARFNNTESFFGKGYALRIRLKMDGYKHEYQMKSKSELWEGTTSHDKTFTFKMSVGESASTISGITFEAYRDDGLGKAGTLSETACESIDVPAYIKPTPETYYLTSTDFGSGNDWHGASITRVIPADESGDIGAPNFTLSYAQKMSIGSEANATEQLGAFQMLLVSGSGTDRKIVAGVNVYKGSNGKKAKLRFYLNNEVEKTLDIDLSYKNAQFNSSQTTRIIKFGADITFYVGGKKYYFRNDAIADTAVTEVTFTFTMFGTKPALKYNGLYWVKFVKDNCDTWRDVPNKFSANDVVEADCETGEIYLNGIRSPEYGALGNDWEEFYLTPGANQIGFSYSDWVDAYHAPSFKLKYREVFL